MTYLCIKNRSELDHLEKYKNVDDLKIKCNLTDIPDLKDFEDLTELDLSDNKIKSLVGFKNLKGLKNLEKLFLTRNSIEHFNGLKYLKNLHNLKILSLTSNKIKSFTMLKELSNLKSLEELYLERSLIENFDGMEQLKTLNNLKYLSLANNNIVTLDISCLLPPLLNHLSLYGNPISKVISLSGFKEHKKSCSIEFFRRDRFTDANYKQFIGVVKDAGLKIKKRTTAFYEDEGEYDVEVIDLWKPPPPSKEFKVNKYITLKLNYKNSTIIYVNNEKFRQCHYLIIEISLDDFKSKSFNNINSIDDLEESPDYSLEISEDESPIPPEDEFWGHCSNLQVWCEQDYDTRILHRNLAFPLLKKLAEVGDKKAQKVFKEEIARRYMSRNKMVREFLKAEGYLDFLSKNELAILEFD